MCRGEELFEKNLRLSLKLGCTSIGVFACIVRRRRSRLWLMRRQVEGEHRTPCDRLGVNAL